MMSPTRRRDPIRPFGLVARRLARVAAIFPALAALLGAAAKAETAYNVPTVTGSGITVRLSTPLTVSPRFGFLPVRILVENLSESDGVWTLRFVGGVPNDFPGEVTGGIELAVASRQNRETWYFLPLPIPGGVANPTNLTGALAGLGRGGQLSVPPIPGVFPPPPGLQSHNVRPQGNRVVNGMQESSFVITQTGPAALLPNMPASSLPPQTTMTVTTPDLVGMVTRRTFVTVQGPIQNPAALNPAGTATNMVTNIARQRLNGSGLTNLNNRTQVTSQIVASPVPGMMEVKVTFQQSGPAGGLQVPPAARSLPNFEFETTPLAGGQARRTISYTETVAIPPGYTPPAPGATAPAGAAPAVLVRAFGGQNYSLNVLLNGPGLSPDSRLNLSSPLNNGGGATPPLATSPATDVLLRGRLGGSAALLLNQIDPTTVPADWRVWSSFHSVIMTESEFSVLDGARQSALRGWVAMGGRLTLIGDTADRPAEESRIGAGKLRLVRSLDDLAATEVVPLLQLDQPAHGLPERSALDLKDTTLGDVVSDTGSSATWLITFLLLFAGIIGPVNLWVFARGNARHRLFWTTPALALAGGLILAIVIVVQDGIGGEGQRAAIVAIVPGQNQAAVFQEQASRTGYLSKRSFALPDEVLLAAIPVEGIVAPVRQQSRLAGLAEGDWFMNRSRQAHLLRQLVPNRGRIEQFGTAPDGAPIVESSLPVPLTSFVLVDAQLRRWAAPEIVPGKRVTLTPAPESARLSAALLGGSPAFQQVLETVTADAPGRWMAYGGASELAPIPTLAAVDWTESRVAYTGLAESRPGGAAGGAVP